MGERDESNAMTCHDAETMLVLVPVTATSRERRQVGQYTPLELALGFTPLSLLFLLYVIAATATYLLLVEGGKRVLLRRRAY